MLAGWLGWPLSESNRNQNSVCVCFTFSLKYTQRQTIRTKRHPKRKTSKNKREEKRNGQMKEPTGNGRRRRQPGRNYGAHAQYAVKQQQQQRIHFIWLFVNSNWLSVRPQRIMPSCDNGSKPCKRLSCAILHIHIAIIYILKQCEMWIWAPPFFHRFRLLHSFIERLLLASRPGWILYIECAGYMIYALLIVFNRFELGKVEPTAIWSLLNPAEECVLKR